MAIVSVGLGDTFDEWRVKTNTVATGQGDLTTLSTTHKASVVGAINELFTSDSDDMENLVDDTSPQLGGQLDLNNNNIAGTGSINITGSGTFSGNVQATLQLTSSNSIVSVGNADVVVTPHGTGDVRLETDTIKVGPSGTDTTITTNGSGTLKLAPNGGGASQPLIQLDNVGDITLNPPGVKQVIVVGTITATTFSGNSVTQSASDNSTKIATTAYVDAQVATENTIAEMDDTNISSPANLQVLQYNTASSKWINATSVGATTGFAVAMAVALG